MLFDCKQKSLPSASSWRDSIKYLVIGGSLWRMYLQYLYLVSQMIREWRVAGVYLLELHTHFEAGPAWSSGPHQHRETVRGRHTNAHLKQTA